MHTKTLLYLQSHQQHISSKWVKLQPFSPCFQHDQKVEMEKYWQGSDDNIPSLGSKPGSQECV